MISKQNSTIPIIIALTINGSVIKRKVDIMIVSSNLKNVSGKIYIKFYLCQKIIIIKYLL